MHYLKIVSNDVHGNEAKVGYYRAADRQLFEAVVERARATFDVIEEKEVRNATPNYRAQGLSWQQLDLPGENDFPGVEALLPNDLQRPKIY